MCQRRDDVTDVIMATLGRRRDSLEARLSGSERRRWSLSQTLARCREPGSELFVKKVAERHWLKGRSKYSIGAGVSRNHRVDGRRVHPGGCPALPSYL